MDMPHTELLAPGPLTGEEDAVVRGDALAVQGRNLEAEDAATLEQLRYLWISGLPEATAKIVGRLAQLERLVVHDYKPKDLGPLSGLRGLRRLAIVNSPPLRSLVGIESLMELRELILFSSCNYSDLGPLASLTRLETLCLEGGFSKQLRVDSFGPLARLTSLRRLRLASIRVADQSLEPLRGLTALRSVFIAKTFRKPELRALAAALPQANGEFLDTYR